MKKHLSTILLLSLLVIGLSLLLYPSFSDWWNSFHQSRAIDGYTQAVGDLTDDCYQALWTAAESYNRLLPDRPNRFLLPPEQEAFYFELLDAGGNGIMGYLEIPSIDLTLPIYHGTAEGVLQVAAGHLEWTSLPVGGKSTHCVLSGHRGLPSARLFTDLDMLEEGDLFTLHVLDRELTYQVDQIRIVEPQDTEELMIREGEDLCTLMTCTPYGINSHRLLVRGRRTEKGEAGPVVYVTGDAVKVRPGTVGLAALGPIMGSMVMFLLIPEKKRRWRS